MLHGEVGLENRPSQPLASDLDPLGQEDFPLATQQRDATHLAEIHTNGIPGVGRVLRNQHLLLRLLPSDLAALLAGDDIRIIPQLQRHLLESHHDAIDHYRITTLVRKVLIDLLKREESPLDRVGDHRLQRTVKTMHGQTPSMEFTSVRAPSAAADIPFRAPHPWCSRSNGLSPTASLLLLRGLSGGHPSREPHRPSRCAAFLACQLRSNYEAAHYQKHPSRPQTIRTIGTVFHNFQRPRLRRLSRARSRSGT